MSWHIAVACLVSFLLGVAAGALWLWREMEKLHHERDAALRKGKAHDHIRSS
jgi:hypothetical protein